MTEERCLRVPYHVLAAVVGWLLGILMMGVSTAGGSDELARWALVVVVGAAVMSVWCMLTRSRARLLDAIDLQLRIHERGREERDLPRIPTLR